MNPTKLSFLQEKINVKKCFFQVAAFLFGLIINSQAIREVRITQGTLVGSTSTTDSGKTYYNFLGIPYAKPPVGSLRFKVNIN